MNVINQAGINRTLLAEHRKEISHCQTGPTFDMRMGICRVTLNPPLFSTKNIDYYGTRNVLKEDV